MNDQVDHHSKPLTATTVAVAWCEAIAKRLNQTYPQAGITFGYIGDCSSRHDDRSWRFFTKIPGVSPDSPNNRSFGSSSTEYLSKLAELAEKILEPELRGWLGLERQVAAQDPLSSAPLKAQAQALYRMSDEVQGRNSEATMKREALNAAAGSIMKVAQQLDKAADEGGFTVLRAQRREALAQGEASNEGQGVQSFPRARA